MSHDKRAYISLLLTPLPPPLFSEIGGQWNKRARNVLFNKTKFLQSGWKISTKWHVKTPCSVVKYLPCPGPVTCFFLVPQLEPLCCNISPKGVIKAKGTLSKWEARWKECLEEEDENYIFWGKEVGRRKVWVKIRMILEVERKVC